MTLGQLIASLGVDTTSIDGAARAMLDFEKKSNVALNNVQTKLNSVSNSFKSFGGTASMYLTAPLALAGGAAFKMAKDFEASMQEIVGLVGISQDQVDQWSKEILDIAPKLGRTPNELAKALYFVTSSGYKSAEAMDIVVQSAKAASAGLGETQKVADLATSAMNAYKASGLTAAKVMDVLTAAVREGKGEASQFASEMGEVIPVSSRMGVSFDQVAAAMAAMTLTGSTVEETATYMRQILVSLLDPIKGSEEALRQMGTSGALMRKELREKGLLSALGTLNDLTKKFGESMMGKVFGNIRALTGVLSLMGDRLEENKILFKVVDDSLGDMNVAFEIASKTMSFRYNAALSQGQSALIAFGMSMKGVIEPILGAFIEKLQSLIQWWNGLSVGTQHIIIKFSALLAILGPVSLALGGIIKLFSWFIMAGGKILAFFNLLRIAIISNPLLAGTIVLGVLTAYALGLVLLGDNAKDAADKQEKLNDAIERGKQLMDTDKSIEERIAVLKSLSKSQIVTLRDDIAAQLKMQDDFSAELLGKLGASNFKVARYKKGSEQEQLKIQYDNSQKSIAQLQTYLKKVEALAKVTPIVTHVPIELTVEQTIMKDLTKDIERVNAESLLMGRTYEINEQLLKVYTSALEKFSAANITTGNSVNFATGMFNALSETLEKSKPEKKVKEITDYAKELQKELALVAYENSIMRDGWDYSEAQRNIDALTSRLQIYRSEMMRLKELQIDTFNKKGIIDPQTTADLTAATTQVSLLQSQLSVLEAQQYIVDNLGNAFSKLGGAIGGTAGEWLSWFGNMVETVPEILKFINAIAVATGMQTAKTAAQTVVTDVQAGSNAALAVSNTTTAATTAVQTVAVIALAHALTAAAVAGALASAAWIPFPANLAAMATAAETLSALLIATNAQAQAAISVGLKSGGVVPPGYPNDSYPAMLTSGEMVTPPGKLPKQELSAATIELKGKFKIEGPDLVYILDKQTMKNNLI